MQTGVDFMPFMFFLIPGSAVAGVVLSKIGQCRPLHALRFVFSTLGPGLNILLKEDTHTGIWATFQIIDAAGRALILPTMLPAVLAPLAEEDVEAATGVYSFLRSFGYVWGITIPSIIFNNRFNKRSHIISDIAVREALRGGRAYELAGGLYIRSLQPDTKSQVVEVYLHALKVVWIAAVAFGASGFIAVLWEKHVPLRTQLDTQYGLETNEKKIDSKLGDSKGVVAL
jgi:hypothetical protein